MNPQVVKAIQLAKRIKLDQNNAEKGPTYMYVTDIENSLITELKDPTFEVRYMMACGQLGYTDPQVTEYARRRLAGQKS